MKIVEEYCGELKKVNDEQNNKIMELRIYAIPNHVKRGAIGWFDSSSKHNTITERITVEKLDNLCDYYDENFHQRVTNKQPHWLNKKGRKSYMIFDVGSELAMDLRDGKNDVFFFAASIKLTGNNTTFLKINDIYNNPSFTIKLPNKAINLMDNKGKSVLYVQIEIRDKWVAFGFMLNKYGRIVFYVSGRDSSIPHNLGPGVFDGLGILSIGPGFEGYVWEIVVFGSKRFGELRLLKKDWIDAIMSYLDDRYRS